MHTTPWFHATNLPNVPAKNLVQVGIGGWQVPREASRSRASARPTSSRCPTWSAGHRQDRRDGAGDGLGRRRHGLHVLRHRLRSTAASCPAPAGPSPAASCRARRSALGLVAPRASAAWSWSRSRPPYDTSDITALLGVRVIVDVLGSMVAHGKLGATKHHRQAGRGLMHDDRPPPGHGHNRQAAAMADAASRPRSRA